jgi:hypothetical protein
LKSEVVGSTPGASYNFVKHFFFTVEKKCVVIKENYDESKLLRKS